MNEAAGSADANGFRGLAVRMPFGHAVLLYACVFSHQCSSKVHARSYQPTRSQAPTTIERGILPNNRLRVYIPQPKGIVTFV